MGLKKMSNSTMSVARKKAMLTTVEAGEAMIFICLQWGYASCCACIN
jgi:hypothetical protein